MANQHELPNYVIDKIKEISNKHYGLSEDQFQLNIARASKNGDSYSGDVYRVVVPSPSIPTINGQDQCPNIQRELTLIVKIPPKTELRRQMYNSGDHFAREHYMYETVLPALDKFQRSHNLSDEKIFNNYPHYYSASSVPHHEYIILSDGNHSGFKNTEKTAPVTYDQCSAVLTDLAKFHAISFAYKDQKPDEFNGMASKLTELLFRSPIHPNLDDFIQKKVPVAVGTLDPEKDTKIIGVLNELEQNIGNKMAEICAVKDDAVILHGDCWISNLLFKGSEPQILFLDWQVARYGTVVIDIAYFLFNCTDSFLRQRLDHLMKMYHNTLIERINELGSDGVKLFPWEKFQSHLKNYMLFGFGMALMSLHATVSPPEDLPNVDEMLEKLTMDKLHDLIYAMAKQPAYRSRMGGVCRDCYNLGYI